MSNFKNKLADYANNIEKEFDNVAVCNSASYATLREAMLYSLKIGGKRIRPIILLEFFKLCGGQCNGAMNFAVALEMIHTYSLIHDDLPCMDDDDFRRGKPSCHKVYGEAAAVLAGDALLTEAFNVASSATDVKPENVVKAINVLSHLSGVNGMIGGQIIDIANEGKDVDIESLCEMYALKTGALIVAAAKIGCILADREDLCPHAEKFAKNIGLAFQIIDDVLDVCGDAATLGKPVNSDSKNQKNTFAVLLGVDKCRDTVNELTSAAIDELKHFEADTRFMKDLAIYLAGRNF